MSEAKNLNLSQQDLEVMHDRGWLARRDPGFARLLLSFAMIREFAEGEALYHYGDAADGLYCIISGAIEVTVPSDDGQEFIAHRDGAGFWIGDLAMLADSPRLVGVVANEPTRAAVIPAARIADILRDHPAYYREFYAITHENMRTALRILANMGVNGADKKLALRILHLAESLTAEDGWIHLSQDQLAMMVGVSLPTAQRLLKRYAKDGAIELGYGRMRILDRGILTNTAET